VGQQRELPGAALSPTRVRRASPQDARRRATLGAPFSDHSLRHWSYLNEQAARPVQGVAWAARQTHGKGRQGNGRAVNGRVRVHSVQR